jgi:hypothetical protein
MSENPEAPRSDDEAVQLLLARQLEGWRNNDERVLEEATAGLAAYANGYGQSRPGTEEERRSLGATPRARLQGALAIQWTAYQVEGSPAKREHAIEQANGAVWATWRDFLERPLE